MTLKSSRKSGTDTGTSKKSNSKPQLRGSTGQFMHFADRLAGAINGTNLGQSADVSNAMNEANGYNIVSSKSHKMLPLNKQDKQTTPKPGAGNLSQGKYNSEQQSNVEKERMRISQSFKSILQRE